MLGIGDFALSLSKYVFNVIVIHPNIACMKSPLILFTTLFLICLLSACGQGSVYYHNDPPCGKVKGLVAKVTDTVYLANSEMPCPVRVSEYKFDSLQRLVEEHYCFYHTEGDSDRADIDPSIEYRSVVKSRYDRSGRKVECRERFYTYTQEHVDILASLMRIVKLKGNREIWEQTYDVPKHEKELFPDRKIIYLHEKNRLTIGYGDDDNYTPSYVSLFDDRGNLIESSATLPEDEAAQSNSFIYNEDNLLVETRTPLGTVSYYQYDEFDNEGNWLKLIELDAEGIVRYVTRRRIEYKI